MSDSDERHRRISESAYFKAERRGFSGNLELDDWLEAERELTSAVTSAESAMPGGVDGDTPVDSAPGPESGNAIPTPLGKEDQLRGEETRESAGELAAAARKNSGVGSNETMSPSGVNAVGTGGSGRSP